MNWDRLEGKWKQMKGVVRAKWGMLTDDDLEAIGGRKDQLIGTIQERYGILREAAEARVDEWLAALRETSPATERHSKAQHKTGRAGQTTGGSL